MHAARRKVWNNQRKVNKLCSQVENNLLTFRRTGYTFVLACTSLPPKLKLQTFSRGEGSSFISEVARPCRVTWTWFGDLGKMFLLCSACWRPVLGLRFSICALPMLSLSLLAPRCRRHGISSFQLFFQTTERMPEQMQIKMHKPNDI